MKRYTNLILNILILTLIFTILKKTLFIINSSAKSHVKNKKNINVFETKVYREKYDINCSLLLKNNTNEIQKAKKFLSSLKKRSHNSTIDLLPDSNFIFSRDKCAEFKKIRRYNRFDKYTSKIELNFPLAFSILTYENVEQFERLLNTIYRSHNIYCIHIDLKSSQVFKNAIKSITDCFDNVFITTKLEYIIYAGYSRLQADLNCLSDLLNMNELLDSGLSPNLFNKKNVYWKYLLNLASSEFPIKTNYQIVKILKILNGSNSIYIDKTYKQLKYRTEHIWFNDYLNNKLYAVKKLIHNRPPHNIQLVKGSAYGVFERGFLENIYLNEKIMDFIEWLKTTFSPDEFFWATLEYNTHLYTKSKFMNTSRDKVYDVSRFAGWQYGYNCGGIFRHQVCIFSFEDLIYIVNHKNLVANKFLLSYDPISYQCMEEWLDHMVELPEKNRLIDENFYCRLYHRRSLIKC